MFGIVTLFHLSFAVFLLVYVFFLHLTSVLILTMSIGRLGFLLGGARGSREGLKRDE